jgi:hypothetical protein
VQVTYSSAAPLLGIACVLLQRRELFNPQHGMTATTA